MLTNTIPATIEAVSLDELKAHLKMEISPSEQDADLQIKLSSAHEYIADTECRGRALTTSTWALTLTHWPACGYIEVPLGNLQSASITYRCSDGTVKPWDAANYRLERVYTPANPDADPPVVGSGTSDCGIGRIYLGYGKSWPSETLDVGEPITVTFICGWDSAAHVPFTLRAAILLVAGTLYRNRESVFMGRSEVAAMLKISGDAGAVESLCQKYADRRF